MGQGSGKLKEITKRSRSAHRIPGSFYMEKGRPEKATQHIYHIIKDFPSSIDLES